MQIVRRRAEGGSREVRRRAPHRDHRRGSGELRIEDLIADEDMAITVTQHRLHQADGDLDLPRPAARRQGPHRHAHARRGLRQPPLHRLDARLHHDLLGPRPRLLAQGPRDPGRRSRRQGQGDRQPGVDGGRRADRRAAGRQGIPEQKTSSSSSWARARAWSRRPTCRRSATRAPAASSRWASRRGTRSSPCELSDGKEQIFLGTRDGMAIRFEETDVRPMGRTAYGVRGIRLREDDEVVAMEVVPRGRHAADRRRRTATASAPSSRNTALQSRGGVGIINIQTSDRNGKVVGIAYVHDDDELMLITPAGHDPAHEGRRHPQPSAARRRASG